MSKVSTPQYEFCNHIGWSGERWKITSSSNFCRGICLWILLYASFMTSQTFLLHQSNRLHTWHYHVSYWLMLKNKSLIRLDYVHTYFFYFFLSLYSICNKIIFNWKSWSYSPLICNFLDIKIYELDDINYKPLRNILVENLELKIWKAKKLTLYLR